MSYYPPTDWELKDFYRDHADVLFKCCSFLTCGKADVQKMSREIFMRMLAKGITFSSDKDARAWMMLSAYKMSRKPPVPVAVVPVEGTGAVEEEGMKFPAEPSEPSEEATDEVTAGECPFVTAPAVSAELPAELRELSRKDRLIAAFYYCEGFRKAEIAKYLGWTTFMVSHRLRRIRRKILQEKGGEEPC